MAGNRSSRAKGRQADQTTESPALPKELSDRLDHLADLPQNWDSYGASPINPKVIQRVRAILREILALGGEDIPLPFVAPAGDGGLELEWTSLSGEELMLELSPEDRPVAFLLVERTDSGEKKETEGTIGDLFTLEEITRRLRGFAAPRGLLAAVGAWADFDGLDQVIQDIYLQRVQSQDRPMSLEQ